MNLINSLLIKKYGCGHPVKGGSLHPRKLIPTLFEMLLAPISTSKRFRVGELTTSCRKKRFRNFTCIRNF